MEIEHLLLFFSKPPQKLGSCVFLSFYFYLEKKFKLHPQAALILFLAPFDPLLSRKKNDFNHHGNTTKIFRKEKPKMPNPKKTKQNIGFGFDHSFQILLTCLSSVI